MVEPTKATKFFLKDQGEGGAMPDTIGEMGDAVENRRAINEKALEGKVDLKYAEPDLVAGDTVILKGLGPRFSGQYIVEKHSLSYSKSDGLKSSFDVSRNAIGDTSSDSRSSTIEGSESPAEDAASGSGSSERQEIPGLTRDEAVEYQETGELPYRYYPHMGPPYYEQ